MIVGARQGGLSISETADLLGFLHTTASIVCREWCKKQKKRVLPLGGCERGLLSHCFPHAMSKHIIVLIASRCILIYITPVCPGLSACVALPIFTFCLSLSEADSNWSTDFLYAERVAEISF